MDKKVTARKLFSFVVFVFTFGILCSFYDTAAYIGMPDELFVVGSIACLVIMAGCVLVGGLYEEIDTEEGEDGEID